MTCEACQRFQTSLFGKRGLLFFSQPPEPDELKVGDPGPLGPSRLLAKTAEAARGAGFKILFSFFRFQAFLKTA